MNKQQRKPAIKEWKLAQRADLLAGMPLSPQQLHRLIDYLDTRYFACEHTSEHTERFLDAENLDKDTVLPWLEEHGGYCDCTVIARLLDLDQSLQQPASQPPRIIPGKKQTPPARSLETLTGWNLSNLPKPWRIANLYLSSEPLRIELGRSGGCTIDIIESPLPPGDHGSDEFWRHLWFARTGLAAKYDHRDQQASRGVLDLPDGFQSILVHAPSRTTVYCWVVPQTESWHLQVRTEMARQAGDLPQISRLISHLARS